jgi:nitrogen fixation/metabolism regulation signal transduction histidine kinase
VAVVADRGELLARSTGSLVGFFLLLVLIVLAAALGIATLISLAATRSLRALETVTERLGQGDLRARAEVRGPRETRKLALALNAMASQLDAGRERLKAAERDRAWTKMARQVAHEIKNPLQPVKLHAELVQRVFGKDEVGPADRDRGRASAEVILRQVEALQRIVADFSAFAQAGQPARDGEGFATGEVLRQVEALYAAGSERGVRVTFAAEGEAARLQGSALRLQQVLVNLIKNAVEASPDGGTVEVGHGTQGARWRAEVRDRGPGLAPEILAHAFEPSFSTKPGGTGLGLAISQRNVDAMGGRIELLPREGGGLVARVELARRST